MTILGIGNILQKDDGFVVYASTYLKENYHFSDKVKIINGGVEGINLFSVFEESDKVLILDTIGVEDKPSSIYLVPAKDLTGEGLNSGGAHEIGVIQCLEMLELQGKALPNTMILGIVPEQITFEIDLSQILKEAFDGYINVTLKFLKEEGIEFFLEEKITSLEEIIFDIRKV
jgi:hydrogenase maturation protease